MFGADDEDESGSECAILKVRDADATDTEYGENNVTEHDAGGVSTTVVPDADFHDDDDSEPFKLSARERAFNEMAVRLWFD